MASVGGKGDKQGNGMEMTRIHHCPCKGQRRKNMNVAGRGNKGLHVPIWEYSECVSAVSVQVGEQVSIVSVQVW